MKQKRNEHYSISVRQGIVAGEDSGRIAPPTSAHRRLSRYCIIFFHCISKDLYSRNIDQIQKKTRSAEHISATLHRGGVA